MKVVLTKPNSQFSQLKCRVSGMEIGAFFEVKTAEERAAALNFAREKFDAGEVKFRLKTWLNADKAYTLMAVKP